MAEGVIDQVKEALARLDQTPLSVDQEIQLLQVKMLLVISRAIRA
jgi:hypothetical protein